MFKRRETHCPAALLRRIVFPVVSAFLLSAALTCGAHAADIDVESLDTDDFTVWADDLSTLDYLKTYHYNLAEWLYATQPDGGMRSFFYDPQTDASREGVVITMRDITLGSSLTEVVNAYGPALLDTTPANDVVYGNAVSRGWPRIKALFDSEIKSSVSYLYRYPAQWRVGEIIFYFNAQNKLCLITYVTGAWPNATFLNDRPVARAVQSQLLADGYDCGGADGVYGPNTRNAIEAWQKDNGQEVNGVIDYALLQSLLPDSLLEDLLADLDVAWGDDYGYEPLTDSYDITNQSGDGNADTTGTWDVESQS